MSTDTSSVHWLDTHIRSNLGLSRHQRKKLHRKQKGWKNYGSYIETSIKYFVVQCELCHKVQAFVYNNNELKYRKSNGYRVFCNECTAKMIEFTFDRGYDNGIGDMR